MLKRLLLVICAGLTLSCQKMNLFEEFGDKESDAARFHQAKMYINKGKYDLALTEFGLMSSGFRAKREVAPLYASAHAGLCGLNFLSLLGAIDDLGSGRLFEMLLGAYTGGSVSRVQHCILAQEILTNVSPWSIERNEDENLLMIFVSFAKIGNILSYHGDSDENKTLDPGVGACDMDEGHVREVLSSISHIYASLMALSDASSFGSGGLAQISSLLASLPLGANPLCDGTADAAGCLGTDPTSYSALEVLIVRNLINEGSIIGWNACVGGATCPCL